MRPSFQRTALAVLAAAAPEFRRAGAAERQELAEALLVQAALVGPSQARYKDDPATAARLAAVRQGAKAFGLDLDAMTDHSRS